MNLTPDLDAMFREVMALNAEAAERYKAIAPPVAPCDAVPGADDLAEIAEPQS
jgi:hypothetical protein